MEINKIKQVILKVSEVRAAEYLKNLEKEKESILGVSSLYEILVTVNKFSWKDEEKLSLISSILKNNFVSDFFKSSEVTVRRNGDLDSSLLVFKSNSFEISFDFEEKMMYIKRRTNTKRFPKPTFNPKFEEFIMFHDNYKSSKSREDRKILVEIYMQINGIISNFLEAMKIKDEELNKTRIQIDTDMETFYTTLKSWTKSQNELEIEEKEDLMLLDDISSIVEFFVKHGWSIEKNICSTMKSIRIGDD